MVSKVRVESRPLVNKLHQVRLGSGSTSISPSSSDRQWFRALFDLDTYLRGIESSAPLSTLIKKAKFHLVLDSDYPCMVRFGILETFGTGHTIVNSFGDSNADEEDLLNGAITGASGINFHALTPWLKLRPMGSGDTVHHWLFRTLNMTKYLKKILAYIGDHPDANFNFVIFGGSTAANTTTIRWYQDLEYQPYVGHEITALLKG